jgi:ferritin-like metal-binding protein YciE
MEKMKDLRDLLKHEVMDLYSAEEQIIAAMPMMIEKATNPQLRQALEEHLRVTEAQRDRLDQVKQHLMGAEEAKEGGKKKGILGLFGGSQKCKGMQGLIEEGQKVMGENMSPEVMDAAIIACAQKIEHYEICGYGTARAFARELNLGEVAELLEETLDEEYEADDLLTDLAVGSINQEAETGEEEEEMEEEEAGSMVMANNTRGRSGSGGESEGEKGNGRSKSGSAGNGGGGGVGNGRSKSSASGGTKAPASKTSSSRSTGSGSGRSSSSGSKSASGGTKKAATKKASGGSSSSGRSSSGSGRSGSSSSGRGRK